MLANVAGSKVGSKGRPLPGSSTIRLWRVHDAATGRFIEDDRGFVRPCADNEVGVLLAKPRSGLDASSVALRSVFAEGDTWITTDHLFRRDVDGDYWFVDNRNTVIESIHGTSLPPTDMRRPRRHHGDRRGRGPIPLRPIHTTSRSRPSRRRRRPDRSRTNHGVERTPHPASAPPSSTLSTGYRSRPPTARCRPHCAMPACRNRRKRPGTTTSLTVRVPTVGRRRMRSRKLIHLKGFRDTLRRAGAVPSYPR